MALEGLGHHVSHTVVADLLHALGYSLQSNVKTREGRQHPDRDAQFRYIAQAVRRWQRRGQPTISVDTKKKEIYALTLGEFIEGEDGEEMPVSMASPLGKALLGGKVGQKVDITLPMGKRKLKIVSVATVHDLAGS